MLCTECMLLLRATTQLQLEGVIASAAHCDVTDKAEVDALVNWTVQTYGGIDLLVANAGIVKGADFLDMSENDFDDVIRVNLKGVFLVSCFLSLTKVDASPAAACCN